jgi:hypothetical protein
VRRSMGDDLRNHHCLWLWVPDHASLVRDDLRISDDSIFKQRTPSLRAKTKQ